MAKDIFTPQQKKVMDKYSQQFRGVRNQTDRP
jgi:hypothetical protein